jgi:hypothetical protein
LLKRVKLLSLAIPTEQVLKRKPTTFEVNRARPGLFISYEKRQFAALYEEHAPISVLGGRS